MRLRCLGLALCAVEERVLPSLSQGSLFRKEASDTQENKLDTRVIILGPLIQFSKGTDDE